MRRFPWRAASLAATVFFAASSAWADIPPTEDAAPSPGHTWVIVLGVVLAAIGAFFYRRRR